MNLILLERCVIARDLPAADPITVWHQFPPPPNTHTHARARARATTIHATQGHLGYRTTDHLPINRGFNTHLGYLQGAESYDHGCRQTTNFVLCLHICVCLYICRIRSPSSTLFITLVTNSGLHTFSRTSPPPPPHTQTHTSCPSLSLLVTLHEAYITAKYPSSSSSLVSRTHFMTPDTDTTGPSAAGMVSAGSATCGTTALLLTKQCWAATSTGSNPNPNSDLNPNPKSDPKLKPKPNPETLNKLNLKLISEP